MFLPSDTHLSVTGAWSIVLIGFKSSFTKEQAHKLPNSNMQFNLTLPCHFKDATAAFYIHVLLCGGPGGPSGSN